MPQINKKYMQDFDKLKRDWERLVANPNPNSNHLNTFMKDLQQFQTDLQNIDV